MSQIPWHKAKSEYQDLGHLTVKAIIGGCTTETPLIEAYAGKAVISPQENTLSGAEIDQNSLTTNREWRE